MKTESKNYRSKNYNPNRLIRSYGRTKSRKLSDHKNKLLKNSFHQYAISDDDFSLNNSYKKYSFEIGFGFGDFLFEKAASTPDQLFFGCEPHLNGVVNILAKLENNPIKNIKISRNDAREILQKFSDGFFDEIYILFPDPWPKAKHFKRRLIDVDFLDNLLAKKIKSGGKLIIATDHASYKTWILSEALKSQKFTWSATSKKDWQIFPADWIETKYQKKAEIEGRVSVIFNLINCSKDANGKVAPHI